MRTQRACYSLLNYSTCMLGVWAYYDTVELSYKGFLITDFCVNVYIFKV